MCVFVYNAVAVLRYRATFYFQFQLPSCLHLVEHHCNPMLYFVVAVSFSKKPPSDTELQPSCITFIAHHTRQAGGEVLWLRTNAAGRTRRRVFSTAGCFRSSPRLRRRVALSLSGRHGDDHIDDADRSKSSRVRTAAPAAVHVQRAKNLVSA